MRKVWIAAAEVQNRLGLVSDAQLEDLRDNETELDVGRILHIERHDTGHDVVAAIREFSEKAPLGGEILHQGMTSEDVLSNAEMLQIKSGLELIDARLDQTLLSFADRIDETADITTLGFTHLQVAEPTTVGYRLARYAQDLLIDKELLTHVRGSLKTKGVKGAVGTSASFAELLADKDMSPREHEDTVMQKLGLEPVIVSGQAYPRKYTDLAVTALSKINGSLHHFALDVQLMQSSTLGEWSEPRRARQVGSSAMPHKQNPNVVENIDAISELLPGYNHASWTTAAFETLERTLRDSGGKRTWLPESFLITDEALIRSERVIRGLRIHEDVIKANLEKYGPFSATEPILVALGKRGAHRQEMHEKLRELAETALRNVRTGKENNLMMLVKQDPEIANYLTEEEIETEFENVNHHVGDAPERAREMAQVIRATINPQTA